MSNPNQQPNLNEDSNRSIIEMAYHGVAAHIAEARMARAGNVLERMDHKQALYSDLGQLALSPLEQRLGRDELEDRVGQFVKGNRANVSDEHWDMMQAGYLPISTNEFRAADTISGALVMPRTFVERRTDKRIDQKAHKKAIASTYTNRTNNINSLVDLRHGYPDNPVNVRPDFHVRERVAEKIFGESKSGPLLPVDVAGRLSEKVFGSPDLAGTSKAERIVAKASVSSRVKKGTLTATEGRIQKAHIDLQPGKLGSTAKEIADKRQRKADKSVRHVAMQEFLSKYRSVRRQRAIGRIQKNQQRITKHRP